MLVRASNWLTVAAVLTLAGCGSQSSTSSGKKIPHIRAITSMYATATSALGGPPADEAQFKAEIEKIKPELDVLDVSSIDELFVSDRDGQPLVIVYGKDRKGAVPEVVAYEQAGKDGIRLVGNRNGQVVEADAAQFANLVPSAKP